MEEQQVAHIVQVAQKIQRLDEEISELRLERERIAASLQKALGAPASKLAPAKPVVAKPKAKVKAKMKPKAKRRKSNGAKSAGGIHAKRILEILKKNPNKIFTTQDIYDALKVVDDDVKAVVRNSINRMVHADVLTRPGKGKYVYEKRGVTPNGEDWISKRILKAMPRGQEMKTKEIIRRARLGSSGKSDHRLQNKIWTLGRDGLLVYVRRGVYKRVKKLK